MGFSYGKIFRLILLLAVFSPALLLRADSDSGVAASLTDFLMPHYRSGILQFILYGETAKNFGAKITLTNPLIDIVARDLSDVELVTLMKGVKPPEDDPGKIKNKNEKRLYLLNASRKDIKEFWAAIPHSQALISSDNAMYDKNKRIVSGEGPIYFRSRYLDIDGEGFDADQKTKFIHVRSKVVAYYYRDGKSLDAERKKLLKEKEQKLNKKND